MGFVSTCTLALTLAIPSSPAMGTASPVTDEAVHGASLEATWQDQVSLARRLVGRLEVQGSHPGVLVRQESAFLLQPDLAVTSALALSNGNGVRVVFGEEARTAKICGLDLMHDVALLRLASPVDLEGELSVKASHLVGTESAAVVGQTVLMEQVAQRCTLTGVTEIAPFFPVAQVQNLSQKGLAGTPLLDERGRVIGMLSARQLTESGTRLVVPGSAIAQLLCQDPVDFHHHLIPDVPDNVESDEYEAWQRFDQGVALLLTGHSDRALEALQAARGERARMWLALAYLAEKRAVEAAQTLTEVLAANEESMELHLLMGEAKAQLGETRPAASEWQKARSYGKDQILTTLTVARGYTLVNREQDALGLLKGVLITHPEFVPALLQRGEIMNRRLRFDEAKRCFERVLAIDDRNPDAWVGMGRLQLNQKRHKHALQSFEKALSLRPKWLPAQIGLCEVALKKKDWERALTLVKPLREQHPEHIELLLIEARSHARLNAAELARDRFEEATFLDPLCIEAHQGLGLMYKELHQYDRAVLAFDEVLRLDPHHSGALFSAGVCHLLKGDRGAARARHKALQRVDRLAADRLFKMIYNK